MSVMSKDHPPQRATWVGRLVSWFFQRLKRLRAQAENLQELVICYGSQTGNAETLARNIQQTLLQHFRKTGNGIHVKLIGLERFHHIEWQDQARVLFVTSTAGQGGLPDQAQRFWQWLTHNEAPALHNLRFAVLGLGDSRYPDFCGGPRQLEQRLSSLGAQPLLPFCACDVDYHTTAQQWLRTVAALFSHGTHAESLTPSPTPTQAKRRIEFLLKRTSAHRLTADSALQAVFHVELTPEGEAIDYQPGDCLSIMPSNHDALVTSIISRLQLQPTQPITIGSETQPLHTWLSERRELFQLPSTLLGLFLECAQTEDEQQRLLRYTQSKDASAQYLQEKDLLDILNDFPTCMPDIAELISLLPALSPRTYSLASAPAVDGSSLHLTVAQKVVTYDGRDRYGLASGYLCDEHPLDQPLRAFLQEAPHFHLPKANKAPILMIGAGTGIAPFRAFLRASQHDHRPLWLMYGARQKNMDALYLSELMQHEQQGLCRVDLALSRESEQLYVQDLLARHANEVWRWIENGAHVYICGSTKMGIGVENALISIAQEAKCSSRDEARTWLLALRQEGRYHKDVY